jgi:hypothetical protein
VRFPLAPLLVLAAWLGGAAAGSAAEVREVAIVGTAFRITLADGSVLAQDDLIGAVLEAADDEGRGLTVRVDGHRADPLDPSGETVLYTLSTPDPAGTSAWVELCGPGPDGVRAGFPLAGAWTVAGGHDPAAPGTFFITCTSGAIGKCVRLSYRPWAAGPDGRSLRDLHQTCVRAIRADYCGDGRAHTVDGTRIDLYDPQSIQEDELAPGMRFEAAWGPEGALCIARPRRPELIPPEALERLCPARLAGRTGPAACGEDTAGGLPGVLLLTKS